MPRLEQADFVVRYSWFITRFTDSLAQHDGEMDDDWYLDPVNSLLQTGEPGELSTVGMLYNSL